MEKIDRLGWASGICWNAYGLKFGLRVNKAVMPEAVYECLPPGWTPAELPFAGHLLYSVKIGTPNATGRVRQFHLVYRGFTRIARTMHLSEVWRTLEADTHFFVAEHAKQGTFIHAGVVGWQGRAILIPGRSFSGKSQLTSALIRAGADYYSDEYAVIGDDGLVRPFSRKLTLRHPGQSSERIHPNQLNATTGTKPLPVGTVVFSKYLSGAQWHPKAVSPAKAMVELLNHTVSVRHRPEQSMSVLHKALGGAQCFKGIRGEAEEVVDRLLSNSTR